MRVTARPCRHACRQHRWAASSSRRRGGRRRGGSSRCGAGACSRRGQAPNCTPVHNERRGRTGQNPRLPRPLGADAPAGSV
jgi:hypothetical protein